jgi:hypothetical protein
MKNTILIIICLFLVSACSEVPRTPGNNPQKTNYTTFKFEEKPDTDVFDAYASWCNASSSGETALVGADPKNYNRRLFVLNDKPARIFVDHGHSTASFMLMHAGGLVKVLTSDNLPTCLSNMVSFQASPDGLSFRYDNRRDISFDVYVQELPSGIQIALDLPSGGAHGLSVVRCETCK